MPKLYRKLRGEGIKGMINGLPKLLGAMIAVIAALGTANRADAIGMVGQPQPDAALKKQIVKIMHDLTSPAGDHASARSSFSLLIEKNATVDLTDFFWGALTDNQTFSSLQATYQDALAAATKPDERAYIRYNLARIVVLRAMAYPAGSARTRILSAATEQLTYINTQSARDPAIAEMRGDIADASGDIDGAVTAYGQIVPWGGSKATSAYKTGLAYFHAKRYGLSARWLQTAAQTVLNDPNSDPMLVHTYFQSFAAASLTNGDFGPAAQALKQSAAPLGALTSVDAPLRIDVARSLLNRGYTADVRIYLEAVAKLEPDDPTVQSLLARARRGVN